VVTNGRDIQPKNVNGDSEKCGFRSCGACASGAQSAIKRSPKANLDYYWILSE